MPMRRLPVEAGHSMKGHQGHVGLCEPSSKKPAWPPPSLPPAPGHRAVLWALRTAPGWQLVVCLKLNLHNRTQSPRKTLPPQHGPRRRCRRSTAWADCSGCTRQGSGGLPLRSVGEQNPQTTRQTAGPTPTVWPVRHQENTRKHSNPKTPNSKAGFVSLWFISSVCSKLHVRK